MQAKELQSTDTWSGFLSEVDQRVQGIYIQMAGCKPEELIRYQAKLQVYQEVKGMLQAVIDRDE
jgi:hypothetical protein